MPVMRFPQEDRLVYEITCECNCCYTESGKCSFESIPSREWPGISPGFSVDCVLSVSETRGSWWLNYALAQGSFALHFLLVDADTNSFISNPVGLDCGAMSTCARIVEAVDRPLNREL